MIQMISQMKVGTRLIVGFALLLFFSAALIVVGLNRMALIQTNFETVVNSDFVKITLVNKMRDAVRFQMLSLRDVVMQEDLSFKKKELKLMKEARKDYQSAAEQLAPLVAHTELSTLVGALRSTEEKVKEVNSAVIEFSLNDQHKEAGEAVREKARPEQHNLIAQLEELLKRLDAKAKVTADEAAQAYKTAASIMVTIGIVAIALGVVIALAITRSIVYPLNFAVSVAKRIADGDLSSSIEVRGSNETADLMAALRDMNASLARIISSVQKASDSVASLGDDLSHSTGQVTQRATSQTERVMAVSAAMEEMSVAVTEISRGAHGVLEASTQTQSIVQESDQNMGRSVAATRRIMETVESSCAAIGELSSAIQKITDVTQVIKSIADQTNLLALNAAIEAARAGEQGRGFAVVADEVRVLAQRTSTSTADIANMIGAVKQKATDVVQSMERVKAEVHEGTRATDTVSQSLRRIVESALRVTELAHQIANATREQTGATEETAKNMEMISQLTAQNTENIQAVEKTAGNLTHTAHELASLVAQFKLAQQ